MARGSDIRGGDLEHMLIGQVAKLAIVTIACLGPFIFPISLEELTNGGGLFYKKRKKKEKRQGGAEHR